VHAISQVFTGAVYDILADLFALERDPLRRDDAVVLHQVGTTLRGLVLRALITAPDRAARYVDVVNAMLRLAVEDNLPLATRNAIVNRFVQRAVVQGEPGQDHVPGVDLLPGVQDAPGAVQDRRACCGTMNLAEYYDVEGLLDVEREQLSKWCAEHGRPAPEPEQTP
jgi:hypothetical protein